MAFLDGGGPEAGDAVVRATDGREGVELMMLGSISVPGTGRNVLESREKSREGDFFAGDAVGGAPVG